MYCYQPNNCQLIHQKIKWVPVLLKLALPYLLKLTTVKRPRERRKSNPLIRSRKRTIYLWRITGERVAAEEWMEICWQEEASCRQKSGNKWFPEGDYNTKLVHFNTNGRRKKKILRLSSVRSRNR